MTTEQVMERYGDLPLTFTSYYKYRFSFEATAPDGSLVHASVGGNADHIYRYQLERDSQITLRGHEWSFAYVNDKDGNEIWKEWIE